MDVQKLFPEKLKQLVLERYPSLDRLYLENNFSKGHLSSILRGKTSPSVAILIRLAGILGVEVKDFFIFPEASNRHQTHALLDACPDDTLDEVTTFLSSKAEGH